MERIKALLSGIKVFEPVSVDGLQVFGLRRENGRSPLYLVLDDALSAGVLELTEVSESGSVPTLKVTNSGDLMVFLMAGEQLVGAKQNRVLNASMMVGGRSTLTVPVSCVEKGRWGYRSRRFQSSGSASHGYLRKKMMIDATEGYRKEGRPTSKQGEIWEEVDRKLARMGSSSPSSALDQAYGDFRGKLDELLKKARVPEGANGVAFAIGGKLAGIDLFDKPETLSKLFPKLVRAYGIDALEETGTGESLDRGALEDWLSRGSDASFEPYNSPGLGKDIRIVSESVAGASLVVEDCAVHIELYPVDSGRPLLSPR